MERMIGFEDLVSDHGKNLRVAGLDDDNGWKSLETPNYPVFEHYDWCPPTPVCFKPQSPLFLTKDFEEDAEIDTAAEEIPDEKKTLSGKPVGPEDGRVSMKNGAAAAAVPSHFPSEANNSRVKGKWHNFARLSSCLAEPHQIPKSKRPLQSPVAAVEREPRPAAVVEKEPFGSRDGRSDEGEMPRMFKRPRLRRNSPLSPSAVVEKKLLPSPPHVVRVEKMQPLPVVEKETLSVPTVVGVKKVKKMNSDSVDPDASVATAVVENEPIDSREGKPNGYEMLKHFKIPKLKRPPSPVVKVKKDPPPPVVKKMPPPPVVRVKKMPPSPVVRVKKMPPSPVVKVKKMNSDSVVKVKKMNSDSVDPDASVATAVFENEPIVSREAKPSGYEMLKHFKIPKLKRPPPPVVKAKKMPPSPVVKVKKMPPSPVVRAKKMNRDPVDPDVLILAPDAEDYRYIFEMDDAAFKGFMKYYGKMVSSYR